MFLPTKTHIPYHLLFFIFLVLLSALLPIVSSTVLPMGSAKRHARPVPHPAAVTELEPGADPSPVDPVLAIERNARSLLEDHRRTKRALAKRTEPDWDIYRTIADESFGFMGQNWALLVIPGNRAMCPDQIDALETCTNTGIDECIPERVWFEDCFESRIVWCQNEYLDMTLICFIGEWIDCESTLHAMWLCTKHTLAPTIPPPTDL